MKHTFSTSPRHGSKKKKKRKTMKDVFTSNGRNSANKFLEGLNKWLFCKKGSIYLVRTNTIEKNNKKKRNKKGDRTKTVSQKAMNKWKKEPLKKKRRRKQIKVIKKKIKQKKHKRERERVRSECDARRSLTLVGRFGELSTSCKGLTTPRHVGWPRLRLCDSRSDVSWASAH